MKKVVDVEIMGQKFTVSSDAEESYIRAVAGFVDGKIQEVLKKVHPSGKFNVAMLTALNIADEYHRLQEEHQAVLNRLGQLNQRISNTLTEEG